MDRSISKSGLVGVAAAVLACAGGDARGDDAPAAPPGSVPAGPVLWVVNQTGGAIAGVRLSRGGEGDFGGNIAEGGMKAGERRAIPAPASPPDRCAFEVQFTERAGGHPVTLAGADLCGMQTLYLKKNGGSPTFFADPDPPRGAKGDKAGVKMAEKSGGGSDKTGSREQAIGGGAPNGGPSGGVSGDREVAGGKADPGPAGGGSPGAQPFRIENRTGLTFMELEVRPDGRGQGTRIALPDEGFRDSKGFKLDPPRGAGCRFSLLLVDTDGREWTVPKVDLCDAATVTLSRTPGGALAVKRTRVGGETER